MEEKILSINNHKEALVILNRELERRTVYKWKTKNGELINVSDMTDEHLLNTIKLLLQQEVLYEIY